MTLLNDIWSKLEPKLAESISTWIMRILMITVTSGGTYFINHHFEQIDADDLVNTYSTIIQQVEKQKIVTVVEKSADCNR